MKLLTLCSLFFFLFSPAAFASDVESVKKITEEKVNAVIDVLKKKEAKKIRDPKVVKIVTPIFDFPRMAKSSLEKTKRKKFTKKQQKAFYILFEELLKKKYLSGFDSYTDEVLKMGVAKAGKKKRISVNTFLVPSDGDKLEILYKFYKHKKRGWQVYDVKVEGVSVISTYRTQFKSMWKKDKSGAENYDAIVAAIKKSIKDFDTVK